MNNLAEYCDNYIKECNRNNDGDKAIYELCWDYLLGLSIMPKEIVTLGRFFNCPVSY